MLLDNEEMRSKANWTREIFNLDTKEVNNLVGKQSYLYRFYLYFISYLKNKLKCYDNQNWLNELIYSQLLDGSITKILNIDSIKNLNIKINPEYFPFLKSPEIKKYYEGEFKEKMKNGNITKYENITFEKLDTDLNIVKTLIIGNNTSLLKIENAIDFVFYNYTKNLYSSYLRFNIQNLEQLFFFADYFVNFIPSIYLYPSFQVKTENGVSTYYGNRLSNAFVSLIPIVVNNSIEKIKKDMESVIVARIAYHKLKSEENIINCNDLFSKVIENREERVYKICSNPIINLENFKSIKKWVYISDCLYSFCKEEEKEELKKLSGLNDVK